MDQKSTPNGESAQFKLEEVDLNAPPEVEPSVDANNIAEKSISKAIEQANNSNPLNSSPTNPAGNQIAVDPSSLIPLTPATTQSNTKQIQVVTDDLQAADNDLIEKAWVLKAKAIVERTKDDPHSQTIEIKKIKADYQKKRFNKDLKIDDE